MRADIDRHYEEGCGALPIEQRELARTLPFRLGLTPQPDIPWSEVFQHRVTLAAPALFAEAMPHADERSVRHATISHMFAVIEAFTTDRIQDEQVPDPEGALKRLAAGLRFVRDSRIQDLDADARSAFAIADRDVRDAHAREQEILKARRGVPLHRYAKISLQKQAVGFPATMALARAERLDHGRRAVIREALSGIWLGLQYADDVLDWEDDYERGGAWAVCIARGLGAEQRAGDDFLTTRSAVFASGALARMLGLAGESFHGTKTLAEQLGAVSLELWADAQHQRMVELEAGEREHPGYALRAHRLRHFAREVLS